MPTTPEIDRSSSGREILGFTVEASDGPIGHIQDLYLDDRLWTVRHLVVETVHPLGRQVLLRPAAIRRVEHARRVLRTDLSGLQIGSGPSSAAARPVSRQHGLLLEHGYRFPSYAVSVAAAVVLTPSMLDRGGEPGDDPHLRSAREIIGYHVHALDDEVGHATDFLFADGSWTIHYLVVSVGGWWPVRKVLVPVGWIAHVSWGARAVEVHLPSASLRLAPAYDPGARDDEEYRERVDHYYGRGPFDAS